MKFLKKIYNGWMKFARALAWVNTRILLGLLYYVVLTPYGLVMRLLRKDPLSRRAKGDSFWVKKEEERDYFKPY